MIDFAVIERAALLFIRPGMIVALTPGLGGMHVPAHVKVGLTVLIGIGLLPSVVVPRGAAELTVGVIVARELAIGLSIAFAMRVLVAGAEFAGYLAGQQIGFSYGATIDPQSGVRNNVLATLYGLLATLGFLAINGHHMVLLALAQSYAALPIGTGGLQPGIVGSVRDLLGMVFVVAFRLAAPIIAVLLVLELVVGLISRSAPSLGFMSVGFPLRLLAGLALLAALVPTIPAVTNALVEQALMAGAAMAQVFR